MNSELYDKTFSVPPDILRYVWKTLMLNPTGDGVKRAKYILFNKRLSYQGLKRLKNFFDHYSQQSGNEIQYALSGGDLMRSFVEKTLASERHAVESGKNAKRDVKTNPNSELTPYKTPRLDGMKSS